MKTTLQQLPLLLQKKLDSAYWLASDEVFLQKTAADLIRSKAQQQGFLNRQVLQVDTHFNWEEVFALCMQRSLFTHRLLLELHVLTAKLSEDDKKALAKLQTLLHPDLCVLMLTAKIETASQKAKWFNALLTPFCFVPIWPIAASQYSSWVQARSGFHQVQLDDNALQILCEKTLGHTLAADQFLQQLKLLYGSARITRDHVQELVHDAAQTDLFAFVDIFLMNNVQHT
ncbi:MAG TPA: DNA polymerase III subunit delta, partial [Gammaproteobacteria bacterium]|nr:DNA polymerase III subunit delta [Gammaproteobacteria bacterium]